MILAILQARISSSRLPGKVMLPILGEPMLIRQLERIQRSKTIDHIVIATSTHPSDEAIAQLCRQKKYSCFQGSLMDVLDRFMCVANMYKPDIVVRLTGDCPLADSNLIDEMITHFLKTHTLDYLSNCNPPTYPDGLDIEIMRLSALEIAWKEAFLPSHREHVTPYIRSQSGRLQIQNYASVNDYSAFRWTVDVAEDFELIKTIYEKLYPINQCFTTEDIYLFLQDNPELTKLNMHIVRNAGSKKSILADQWFLGNMR